MLVTFKTALLTVLEVPEWGPQSQESDHMASANTRDLHANSCVTRWTGLDM